jgi:hypothetical protein
VGCVFQGCFQSIATLLATCHVVRACQRLSVIDNELYERALRMVGQSEACSTGPRPQLWLCSKSTLSRTKSEESTQLHAMATEKSDPHWSITP